MKNSKYITFALGLTICLIGAYLMAFGEPIVGANHTGVATVVAIIGIATITVSNTTLLLGKKEEKVNQ